MYLGIVILSEKEVLRRDFKAVMVVKALMYVGSAFYRVGPATPKALLRITVDLVKGTLNRS